MDNLRLVTVQNDGVPVYDFRCSDGTFVTIPDQSCRDIPEYQYDEVKAEFPHLRYIGSVDGDIMDIVLKTEPTKEVDDQLELEQPVEKNDFLKNLERENLFICSVCAKTFKSHTLMRMHMGKSHK